MTKAKFNIVCE